MKNNKMCLCFAWKKITQEIISLTHILLLQKVAHSVFLSRRETLQVHNGGDVMMTVEASHQAVGDSAFCDSGDVLASGITNGSSNSPDLL